MAASNANIFRLKTFCVVTGASRGLGRCISVKFGGRFPLGSVLVLIARDANGLEETKRLVGAVSPVVTIETVVMDLGKQNEAAFDEVLCRVLSQTGTKSDQFDQALIVHNAATLGPIHKHFTEIDEWGEVARYFDLNVTSFVTLNNVFLRHFNNECVSHRLVINISSICALQPFKSWALYCAGKAARDMLFRTMALEDSSVRVLNYAPGPVETDMNKEARTLSADKELRQMFNDMLVKKKLLSCDESVMRLVKILEHNKFDSGAHIDYYDREAFLH